MSDEVKALYGLFALFITITICITLVEIFGPRENNSQLATEPTPIEGQK